MDIHGALAFTPSLTPPPTHTQEINNSHAFPCSFMIAEKG